MEWVAIPFSRGSSQPMSPALQAESLPSEPPGNPKDTGVGSLSLLQRSFLTQELNRGLLHCRQILYQLSYQGSLADISEYLTREINDTWTSPPTLTVFCTKMNGRGVENEQGCIWKADWILCSLYFCYYPYLKSPPNPCSGWYQPVTSGAIGQLSPLTPNLKSIFLHEIGS